MKGISMQTRRQWHVALDAPTAEELDAKIVTQDRDALDKGYVRLSSQRRAFGSMGVTEALVYEEASRGSPVSERAEMLGTKASGPSTNVPVIFLIIVGAIVAIALVLMAQGRFPY